MHYRKNCMSKPGNTLINALKEAKQKGLATLQTSPDVDKINIRKATPQDFAGIWEIFSQVIASGDTYAHLPNTTKEEAFEYWMALGTHTYVALTNNNIIGAYYLRSNQPGLGSHIANAAYIVHPNHQGQGVGNKLAMHSLEEAKKLKFIAIQFNLVVSTNQVAVNLWKKIGFEIIGKTPKGFKHATLGLVDTFIMYKSLTD